MQKERREAGLADRAWRVAVEAAVRALEAGRIGQTAEESVLARREALACRQSRKEAN